MNEFTYTVITSELGNDSIKRISKDGVECIIPVDEANSDYIAYLASLDESTVVPEIIEPAEESEPTEPADEPSPDTE